LVDIIEECLGAAAMMFVWRGKRDVWPGLIEEGQVESRGSEKGVVTSEGHGLVVGERSKL
jgi:hypothetical protein